MSLFRARLLFIVILPLVSVHVCAEVNVLVTIKPLQLIAAAIQDQGSLTTLTDPDVSAHHFTLSPSDRTAIAGADLVIYVGSNLETQLDGIIQRTKDQHQILSLMMLPGMNVLDLQGNESQAMDTPMINLDPHIWLDTANALVIAAAIRDKLITLDPDGEKNYRDNYQLFATQIAALDSVLQNQFLGIVNKPYLVYHNAIAYFESSIGFDHSLILVSDPEVSPGIARILEVRALVPDIKPACLFLERSGNAPVVRTMLNDYPLPIISLDLLGSDIDEGSGYVDLMTTLANDFASCF